MCGIVAIADFEGKSVPSAVLRRMTAALHHRGPDDGGFARIDPVAGESLVWTADRPPRGSLSGVLFGHRRLSILDLTAAARQPLCNDDGSILLVYNGEIYNFIEIREELRARGIRFRSTGDTEVVLKAYQTWGEDTFSKLNGMWALALWDGRQRKLVVSRDRFGIKPLHYAVIDGTWVFASEIRALLLYPGVWRGFDEGRVTDFLVHGLANHDELSLFQGIQSVPCGACIEISAHGPRVRRYWSLPIRAIPEVTDEKEAIEQVRDLMIDSVRLRMRSDVPTGTMLSAGLDSATITALVRQLKRPCSSAIGPAEEGFRNVHHAFTACWPGWHGDEEPDVDLLAAALGLRLHKLYLRAEDVPGLLSEVLYLLDEPFPSPIPVVQYLLMKMARDNGVKVVLNGHGSDEVWAGYAGRFVPRFLADLLWSGRLSRLVKEYRAFRATGELTARSFLLNSLAGLAPVRLRSRARASLRRGARELADIVPHVRPHYSPLALESASSGASLVRESLLVCFAESVLPMWLRMEDRVSMASSVESRLPFLDHRLIELGFALADSLKLRDGYTKYVLRKAMSETLPASLVSRRRKQRFRPPTSQWLGSDALQPILEDLLGGPCRVQPYLNLKAFRKRLRSYLAREAHALNALVLWRVLNVEIWMRAFEEAQRRPAALDPRERVVVARGRTG